MKRLTVSLVTMAAALASGAAPIMAQDTTRVFQPSGSWTADFGDDYCRLMRTFTDGRDTISISIEKIDTGPTMRLLVLGNAISIFRGSDQIGVDFLPTDSPRQLPFARSTSTDGQQLLIFSGLSLMSGDAPAFVQTRAADGANSQDGAAPVQMPGPAERDAMELAEAAQITALGLGAGLTTPVRLETGSLRNAVEVLQTCGYDLVSSWGLDGEKHRNLSRGTFPMPGQLIANGTIPFGEFGRLAGGSNMVRVMVNADGTPTACHIHFASLSEGVNREVCSQVMANGRFNPALDADGQPMASYWTVAPFALGGPPPGRR